jgi:CHASE2 domain-containing sensor protein/signal transduction histidine kinase
LIEWFATGIVASAILAILLVTGVTARLDNALYDTALKLQHRKPSPDIVIVGVDQDSLRREGEWPWPRRLQGDLISRIGRDHPRAIGWFFIYASATDEADDQVVHDAMLGTPTYVGSSVQTPFGARTNPPKLLATSAAVGSGAAEVQGDESDGIVRHAFLFEGSRDDLRPTLALLLAHRMGYQPPSSTDAQRPMGLSNIVFHAGDLLIPYVTPHDSSKRLSSFKTVSAASVLQGRSPPGAFANKLVLVGATAPNLLDDYPTPVSGASGMPNVELQANIVDALLSGAAITAASRISTLLISLVLTWLLLTSLLRLAPSGNLWLFAVMTALPLVGAVLGVLFLRIWAPPASFLVTEAIIIPYWGWRRLNAASAYLAEELSALEQSVGKAVLARSPAASRIGGDLVLQQMTLLQDAKARVSDLRRFVADILANFPDPVLVVNRAGRILTVNQAASDFAAGMGLTATEEAAVEPILDRLTLLDQQTTPIWPPVERLPSARSASGLAPLTALAPGGRAYEVRFTSTRSAGDEPTGWIVHLADVTPLVTALRQREETMELLSHDMRSPQSAILATLAHPEFQGAPATLRRRIETHARRTLELADSFVRLAKAESANYALEPIDLAHIAQDAAEAVWALAHAADVSVHLDHDDVEFVVMADRGLLTRALINLLDNAVKFSPPGERVICRLRHAATEGTPTVVCQIIDHAGGLGSRDAATLFKRFGMSRGTARGTAGVGLGLAMVHTVVTRHSGDIVCESVQGHGAVFTITLPLHQEAEAAHPVEVEGAT